MDAFATMMRQRCRSSILRGNRAVGCFVQFLILSSPDFTGQPLRCFSLNCALHNDLGQGVLTGDVTISSQFPSLDRGKEWILLARVVGTNVLEAVHFFKFIRDQCDGGWCLLGADIHRDCFYPGLLPFRMLLLFFPVWW